MTVQTVTAKTNKKVVRKTRNLGDTVSWTSHANGQFTTKMGKIVAILRPDVNYRYFSNVSKALLEEILREQGFSRKEARERVNKYGNHYWIREFREKYQLKFNPREGMLRDSYHYLVEVDNDGGKPYLYHPATHSLD